MCEYRSLKLAATLRTERDEQDPTRRTLLRMAESSAQDAHCTRGDVLRLRHELESRDLELAEVKDALALALTYVPKASGRLSRRRSFFRRRSSGSRSSLSLFGTPRGTATTNGSDARDRRPVRKGRAVRRRPPRGTRASLCELSLFSRRAGGRRPEPRVVVLVAGRLRNGRVARDAAAERRRHRGRRQRRPVARHAGLA